jgi:hypothetical protein
MRPGDYDKPKTLNRYSGPGFNETEWYKSAINTADTAAEVFRDDLRDKGYDEETVKREGARHRAGVLQEMVSEYEKYRYGESMEGSDASDNSPEDGGWVRDIYEADESADDSTGDDEWIRDGAEAVGDAVDSAADSAGEDDWVRDEPETGDESDLNDPEGAEFTEDEELKGTVHLEMEADSEVVAEGDFDINDEDAEISATVPRSAEVVGREVVEVEDPDLEKGEVEETTYENDAESTTETDSSGESEYIEPEEIVVRRVGTGEASENAEESTEQAQNLSDEGSSMEESSMEVPPEIPQDVTEEEIEALEEEQIETLEDTPEQAAEAISEEEIEVLEDAHEQAAEMGPEEDIEVLEDTPDQGTEAVFEEDIEVLEDTPDQGTEAVSEEEQIEVLEDIPEQATDVVQEENIEVLEGAPEQVSEVVTAEQTEAPADDADKELFGLERLKELVPTNEVIRRRLEDCGITDVELDGVLDKYQEVIARDVEEMCASYPELKGYITRISAARLKPGVFACAGPRMTENGYATEVNVSVDEFGHRGMEFKVSNMETPNWKGETWFSGHGQDAILKHEMGHILHLQMLAKERGIELGEKDRAAYDDLCRAYDENDIVTNMCRESMNELDISPGDLARNISIYGASDWGECFAEAISEVETRKNPRAFARRVYEKYQEVRR